MFCSCCIPCGMVIHMRRNTQKYSTKIHKRLQYYISRPTWKSFKNHEFCFPQNSGISNFFNYCFFLAKFNYCFFVFWQRIIALWCVDICFCGSHLICWKPFTRKEILLIWFEGYYLPTKMKISTQYIYTSHNSSFNDLIINLCLKIKTY